MIPPSVECGAMHPVVGAAARTRSPASTLTLSAQPAAEEQPTELVDVVPMGDSAKRAAVLVTFLDHYRRDAAKCQVGAAMKPGPAPPATHKLSSKSQNFVFDFDSDLRYGWHVFLLFLAII